MVLLAEVIIPHLQGTHSIQTRYQLNSFSHRATSINGAGRRSTDWSIAIEQLTMRVDLQSLTVRSWASGLPTRGLWYSAPDIE